MIHIPEKNKKINATAVLVMVILLAVAITAVYIFELPTVIWHAVFFVEAIILCELLTKFMLPKYVYSFENDMFTIVKHLGKRVTTVCQIDSYRIVALYGKDEYKKQELYKPRNVYNYNANFASNSCFYLVFEYSDCCEAVLFEPDNEMVNAILSSIKNR